MPSPENLRNPEINSQVASYLQAFPILGGLRYIAQETGLSSGIQTGGVRPDPEAGKHYGPRKMRGGVLGFLYSTGQLNIDRMTNRYAISESSLINQENLEASGAALAVAQRIGDDITEVSQSDLDGIPDSLKPDLVVPAMHALQKAVEPYSKDSGSVIQSIQSLLDNDTSYEVMQGLFKQLDLVDFDGALNEVATKLLTHKVMGSYARLTASYIKLISNLHDAGANPDECRFGGRYARDQETNAIASNKLITNLTGNLRPHIAEVGPKLLDLGSGGGVFALEVGAQEVVLFDMSPTANEIAQSLLESYGVPRDNISAITGDLTNFDNLLKASLSEPDVVTINFIIHDIMGQASSYGEGLNIVRQFLTGYRAAFGPTPLFVTESWDVDWEDLREANDEKSYITVYTLLHAISPQRLISREVFMEMVEEAGFEVGKELPNGSMKIKGKTTDINETLMLIAA